MMYRIIELVINNDTYGLFTNSSPKNLKDVIDKIQDFITLSDFKKELTDFFRLFISSKEDIYHYESIRMLKFIDRLFKEAEELKKEYDYTDVVIKMYSESLINFSGGNEKLRKYIDSLLK